MTETHPEGDAVGEEATVIVPAYPGVGPKNSASALTLNVAVTAPGLLTEVSVVYLAEAFPETEATLPAGSVKSEAS